MFVAEWQVTEGALNLINMAPFVVRLFSIMSQVRYVGPDSICLGWESIALC